MQVLYGIHQRLQIIDPIFFPVENGLPHPAVHLRIIIEGGMKFPRYPVIPYYILLTEIIKLAGELGRLIRIFQFADLLRRLPDPNDQPHMILLPDPPADPRDLLPHLFLVIPQKDQIVDIYIPLDHESVLILFQMFIDLLEDGEPHQLIHILVFHARAERRRKHQADSHEHLSCRIDPDLLKMLIQVP